MPYGLPEDKPPVATIKVLMLRTDRGCPDGFTPTTYVAGETYDLPEDLAHCFFAAGSADPAEAHAGAHQQPSQSQAAQEPQGEAAAAEARHVAPNGRKTRPRPSQPARRA